MDRIDLYWNFYREQRDSARDINRERGALSSLIMVVSGGLLAFVVNQRLSPQTIPVSLFIILLGFFGAFSTRLAYWYSKRCRLRAIKCLESIDRMQDQPVFREVRDVKNSDTWLVRRVSLHYVWLAFHLLVSILGVLCIVIALTRMTEPVGAANGSQPTRPETNTTSSAAGSRH